MSAKETELTLVNFCYEKLKEEIIRGDFQPGEKLRIAKLKSHLKIGPTPIREALSRLISSGLIVAEANRGFYVKKVSEHEVCDIYDTFLKIELLALEKAIELGDTTWEANILASLHKLSLVEKSKTPVNAQQWIKLNYAFHYSLIIGCNSECLLKIRDEVYQLFDHYCHLSFLLNQEMLAQIHNEHSEIAKAVIKRDKDKARKLLTSHLEKSLEQVLNKLKLYVRN